MSKDQAQSGKDNTTTGKEASTTRDDAVIKDLEQRTDTNKIKGGATKKLL